MNQSVDKLLNVAEKYKQEGRKRLYDSLAIALSCGFSYVLTEVIINNFTISVTFGTLFFLIESINFIIALLINKTIWDRNRIAWAKLNGDRNRLKAVEELLIELKKECDNDIKRIKTFGLQEDKEQEKILHRYEEFEKLQEKLTKEREKILIPARSEKLLTK